MQSKHSVSCQGWKAATFIVKSFHILKTTVCHEAVEEVALAPCLFVSGSQVRHSVHPSSVTYRNQRSLSLGFGFVKLTHKVADLRNTSPS